MMRPARHLVVFSAPTKFRSLIVFNGVVCTRVCVFFSPCVEFQRLTSASMGEYCPEGFLFMLDVGTYELKFPSLGSDKKKLEAFNKVYK